MHPNPVLGGADTTPPEELQMQSAYDTYQEGSRLLASENAHAAIVALERARELEPDKGSVRETLARAYYRSGRFAARAPSSSVPSRSNR